MVASIMVWLAVSGRNFHLNAIPNQQGMMKQLVIQYRFFKLLRIH